MLKTYIMNYAPYLNAGCCGVFLSFAQLSLRDFLSYLLTYMKPFSNKQRDTDAGVDAGF